MRQRIERWKLKEKLRTHGNPMGDQRLVKRQLLCNHTYSCNALMCQKITVLLYFQIRIKIRQYPFSCFFNWPKFTGTLLRHTWDFFYYIGQTIALLLFDRYNKKYLMYVNIFFSVFQKLAPLGRRRHSGYKKHYTKNPPWGIIRKEYSQVQLYLVAHTVGYL